MIKRCLRRSAVAIGSAMAAISLLALTMAPAASADTMRTLNLSLVCSTGEAYGLQVSTGSGWYQPSGSSYVVGDVKYFTVSIPATATQLDFMPLSCDSQPYAQGGPYWVWRPNTITAGTSTINAAGYCNDYSYNYSGGSALLFDCSLSSVTYS